MTEFKKGDKVRALDNYPGSFTKGKEYEVGGSYYDHGYTTRCNVVSDDSGTCNGWGMEKFELVTRKDEPTGPVTIETVKRINPGSGMDAGEFVKQPIEITPTANGGYVVRRQPAAFEMSAISTWLAFSDYTDLLNWLTDEYPAANTADALEGK